MIEISGIHVPLSALDGTDSQELKVLRRAVVRRLHLRPQDVARIERRKRSIDARKKGDVQLVFTVRAELAGGDEAEQRVLDDLGSRHDAKNVRAVCEMPFSLARAPHALECRPVVVGAGCAGLFCALALAEAGLEPLLVERGDDATRRTSMVERHNATGELDPECNIQFGMGGAGTFSDGKLQTGTRAPSHRLILQTFVDAGAQQEILWDAKPHIGSDVLPDVVTNIVSRIEEAGGEVRCRTRMTGLQLEDAPAGRRVAGMTLVSTGPDGAQREERVATDCVVLACGHSARDVYELLQGLGVTLERKTFAMGVRIEHPQHLIDESLYGRSAGNPALGAAPYSLSVNVPGGRSAFSFCMCPGGYVVSAASEPGGVCTNGMSLSDRAGTNANAGLLANVFPEDLPGDDPLAGMELQRACERAAFAAGGGAYVAPAQLVADFLQGVPSSMGGRVEPTYPRGVTWGDVSECLPSYVSQTLRAAIPLLDRRLHGFALADAVLTGVETRSSSPVRVTRGDDLQSLGCAGLWPCGEGAGYAGGIMSAAADGIRVAQAIVRGV